MHGLARAPVESGQRSDHHLRFRPLSPLGSGDPADHGVIPQITRARTMLDGKVRARCEPGACNTFHSDPDERLRPTIRRPRRPPPALLRARVSARFLHPRSPGGIRGKEAAAHAHRSLRAPAAARLGRLGHGVRGLRSTAASVGRAEAPERADGRSPGALQARVSSTPERPASECGELRGALLRRRRVVLHHGAPRRHRPPELRAARPGLRRDPRARRHPPARRGARRAPRRGHRPPGREALERHRHRERQGGAPRLRRGEGRNPAPASPART